MTARTATLPAPFQTAAGAVIPALQVRYESWGRLNAARTNAVLVCHSLTKASHAARHGSGPAGWWDAAIGPGRMIDTNRWFVICASTLGAAGSTGPASPHPATGRAYGLRFPVVEVRDMAAAQRLLLDHLGIDTVHLAIGGCFGGQQVLELAINYPASVRNAVVISTTAETSAHTIAIFSVMRRLIRSDPAWQDGDYYGGLLPSAGLGNAIAAATPLWMNRDAMEARFGRDLTDRAGEYRHRLDGEFAVEEFIGRLADRAITSIDPNGLMYLTRAVEYFDLGREYGSLPDALAPVTARTLFVSYSSDWRYPPAQVDALHQVRATGGSDSTHAVLDSTLGHGGFLHDTGGLQLAVEKFLAEDAP